MKKTVGTVLLVLAASIMVLHGFFVELAASCSLRAGVVDNAIMLSTLSGVVFIVEYETKSSLIKGIADLFLTVIREG